MWHCAQTHPCIALKPELRSVRPIGLGPFVSLPLSRFCWSPNTPSEAPPQGLWTCYFSAWDALPPQSHDFSRPSFRVASIDPSMQNRAPDHLPHWFWLYHQACLSQLWKKRKKLKTTFSIIRRGIVWFRYYSCNTGLQWVICICHSILNCY